MKRGGYPHQMKVRERRAGGPRFISGGKFRRFSKMLFLLPVLFLFFGVTPRLYPEDDPGERGEAAMARRYVLWAKDKIEEGLWAEALAGLERASDFADVSSDISWLLALALSHEKKPLPLILEALTRSLVIDRWNIYAPGEARLLRAETLIALRAYSEAMDELSRAERNPREAMLTLRVLNASGHWQFREAMSNILDRYPRESGPARIFFDFLESEASAGRSPEKEDLQLLELILRRLPVLSLKDRELAWIAAPFMRDTAEAKRLVEAYRASGEPARASLPATLRLGIIDEETALGELFAPSEEAPFLGETAGDARTNDTEKILDMALLAKIWELLRHEDARALFRRNLSAYTGVINEDEDRDGIPEISVEYSGGQLKSYVYDADQDRIPDLTVYFEAGDPRRALAAIPPESSRGEQRAEIEWERYPAVLEVRLNGIHYIPRPLDFHYSPVVFDTLWGSGPLFPRRDPLYPLLTRRVLVSRALQVKRAGLEFGGSTEVVDLAQGIPVAAREYLDSRLVSETEFLRGRPQIQRVDLDLDGRMETVRFFRRGYRTVEIEDLWDYDRDIEYTESDWDGDGIFESGDSF